MPDKTFEDLGLPRDLETFLKSGIFQQPLKNKEEDRDEPGRRSSAGVQ